MTPAEATLHARRIAVALGETGAEGQSPLPLVLMQLSRIVRLMGVEWTEERLQAATAGRALALERGLSPWSLGGSFFALCRDATYPMIAAGTLTRRDFCRTFCVRPREKKARKPKASPQKPNVCRGCGAYVGPESVPHRCPTVVGHMGEAKGEPGTVQHTTRGGKGHVGRAIDKQRLPRHKRPAVEAEVYVVRRKVT